VLRYTKNFASYGRIEVASNLNGLDNADRAAFLHLRADVREFNSGHVAELFLSVVCYSNGSDAVLDDDVLVILAVSNLHDGCTPALKPRAFSAPGALVILKAYIRLGGA